MKEKNQIFNKNLEDSSIEIGKKFNKNSSKKPLRLIIILFLAIFLVGLLLGLVGGYYYANKKDLKNNQSQNVGEVSQPYSMPESTQSNEPVEQTYTVQKGDTLFTIGLKFNIPWTKIAEANGLSENSIIKEGQVLKIPIVSSSSIGESKQFPIDNTLMQKIQSQVDEGQNLWYLDPVAVAKNQVPPTYSISKDDDYSLKSKNTAEGIAIVEVVHDTKIYQIKLVQPVKKGTEGIWAVESVTRI